MSNHIQVDYLANFQNMRLSDNGNPPQPQHRSGGGVYQQQSNSPVGGRMVGHSPSNSNSPLHLQHHHQQQQHQQTPQHQLKMIPKYGKVNYSSPTHSASPSQHSGSRTSLAGAGGGGGHVYENLDYYSIDG